MPRLIEEDEKASLLGMLTEGIALSGGEITEDYSHDEMEGFRASPGLVIKPKTAEEVKKVMAYCYERYIPVSPRGSGTGLVGGAVPVEGGVALDLSGMSNILHLDIENLSLDVEPGVLLMDINEYLSSYGLFYPPDPGEKSATIGGNISTNAGGMKAIKYGATRDYVRSLKVVLSDGSSMELGANTKKSSSGYSLKDLIIGSEGTLAIVVGATLRLLPLPGKAISLLAPFGSIGAAVGCVPNLLRSSLSPSAVEYMSKETISLSESYLGKKFPNSGSPAYLLVMLEGKSKAALEPEISLASEMLLENGAEDVFMIEAKERSDAVWNARGAFLEGVKSSTDEMDECDVVVPISHIGEFLEYAHRSGGETGLRVESFGHAGDGNLHIYLCRDHKPEGEWESKKAYLFEALYHKAFELGGMVSGEHGVGYAKRAYLKEQIGETQYDLMGKIKRAFDPRNILNPGKVVS